MAGGGAGSGPDGNGDDRRGADGLAGALPRLNQYFDALSNERRRYLLYYLQGRATASVDDLARAVVARETARPPGSLAEDDYANAMSELHHKHLPRLVDYGLVEYDPRSRQVRFRESNRTFAALLWLSQLLEGG